jgi:hypothetical protein
MVQASDAGVLNALRFAIGLDCDRVWAVETAGTSPVGLSARCSVRASA